MNPALIFGIIVLVAAIVAAWYLARGTYKTGWKKEMACPHCHENIPHESKFCPTCEKEIRKCKTCGSYIVEQDGACEVCGSRHAGPKAVKYFCPKCEAPVPGNAKKCLKCKEQFWSPIVRNQ